MRRSLRPKKRGRLFTVGTDTSDGWECGAAECPRHSEFRRILVQAIIAGGYEACYRAVEASEDDAGAGRADLEARGFTKADVLVGSLPPDERPTRVGAVALLANLVR